MATRKQGLLEIMQIIYYTYIAKVAIGNKKKCLEQENIKDYNNINDK